LIDHNIKSFFRSIFIFKKFITKEEIQYNFST
jgi:hypothetical protein